MNQKLKKIKEAVQKLNTNCYKFVEPYIVNINQCIGKGSFGQVYKGIDIRTNQLIAVKQISTKTLQKDPVKLFEALKNEIQIMKKAKHQNIVILYDVLKSTNNIYLFLELCNKGSLEQLIKKQSKISEKQVIEIARQLINGYSFLHQNGIMHRDLKPANILIKDQSYKIADFGFAKIYQSNKPQQRIHQTLVGSPIYMCPQILNGTTYSTKCDVWSLGIILYQLIFGRPPFIVKNLNQLIRAVNKKEIKFPFSLVNKKLETMIRQMLIYDQNDRISWKQLFQYQLFKTKKQSLQATLKNSIQMAEKLYQTNIQKSQAINKLYFEENKVIEKIELDQKQQQQFKQVTENQVVQKCVEPEDLFKQVEKKYDTHQKRKQLIKRVAKYFLNKRNKAVFLNHLSLKLYECFEQNLINIPIENAQIILLVLSKYQCGIIYKSYVRLKQQKLLNCKKFTLEEFKLFMQSPLKPKIFQNFANDFKVMKMFFDQLIVKVKDHIKRLTEAKKMTEKIEKIQKICNNNIPPKDVFRNIFSQTMQDFLKFIQNGIKKNAHRSVLQMGYLATRAITIQKMSYEKSQYNLFYEQAKRLSDDELIKIINS